MSIFDAGEGSGSECHTKCHTNKSPFFGETIKLNNDTVDCID